MRRVAVACLALYGCSDASFQRCSVRCTDLGGCPSGLQCLDDRFCHEPADLDTCSEGLDGGPDAPELDAPALDAPPPDAGIDAVPRPNDKPEDALVTAGGTFVIDWSEMTDDTSTSCLGGSAKDVFFEVSHDAFFVLYVETTDFAVVALRNGPCATATEELACKVETCLPTGVTQLAERLPGGTYCIVVEDVNVGAPTVVEIDRTLLGFPPLPASPPFSDTMCTHPDDQDLTCLGGPTDEDLQMFFPLCPGDWQLVFDSCENDAYAPSLGLARDSYDAAPICGGPCPSGLGSRLNATVSGPALYWIIMDGAGCGTFSLDWSIVAL